jgi:hypothetical protein
VVITNLAPAQHLDLRYAPVFEAALDFESAA